MGKIQDLSGLRFGRLVVIRDVGRLHGGVLWECQCDCGRISNFRACSLKNGDAKTCGNRGQCHHAWEGGCRNKGSVAWAKRKITLARKKAEKRGHTGFTCTPQEYLKLWRDSGDCCQLCGIHENETQQGYLCVDHCHDTGRIRGILCGACNSGIGMFAESETRMQKAIDYLRKHKEATSTSPARSTCTITSI